MRKFILFFLIPITLCIVSGCNKNNDNKDDDHSSHNHTTEEGHDHSRESEATENNPDIVEMDAFLAENAGLEIITVQPTTFNQVIKTSGQILSAQGDDITISANMSGSISFNKASISEGAAVRSGESLLSISSRNIIDGDPVSKARVSYNIAKQELDRAESLIEDKLISQKEYNEIKLNYENAKIANQAFSGNSSTKGINISSPMTGYIKSRLVSEGQYVETGQPLVTITQNKKMQLKAEVSEKYYGYLPYITSANFKTAYDENLYQLLNLNGKIISFGKSSADNSYYIPVYFEFDNVGNLISGSYVEIYLMAKPRENVIAIPLSGLVEDQGIYSVYIKVDENHFVKKEVKTGANNGQNIEILSGLNMGDKVVSNGAYQVKLASASTNIPHGHEH